jgi:bacterioferritin (cytochrome b1)
VYKKVIDHYRQGLSHCSEIQSYDEKKLTNSLVDCLLELEGDPDLENPDNDLKNGCYANEELACEVSEQ